MDALHRVLCAGRGGRADRVPVAPYLGNHGARVAGVRIGDYCRSGKLMAEAQLKAWEIYGQDAVVAQSDNYYIAEGFGVVVEHHADSIPTFASPAVASLREADRLEPPDPRRDGRMPVYLEAIERLAEATRGRVAVRAPGTGAFSLASHLMGTQAFLMELAEAEATGDAEAQAALRRLLEASTEALIAFAKACLEAGANLVQSGDSLASTDVISPATYMKWAYPYERRFFEEVGPIARAGSAATLLHICGDTTPILGAMADTGAMILEIDSKVSLKEARRAVGDGVCLMGNLHPVELLLQGSPAQVEAASLRAIEDAGADGGFILGSGCEVPVAAPRENLAAMVRAGHARACPP